MTDVRALGPADVARYRALMLQAYASEPDAFTSTPEERAAEPPAWWLARLQHPQGLSQVFGAFRGDALVGTVTVEFSGRAKTRHKAHLVGMFVDTPARGLGAGRALLAAALAAARAQPGVQVATLTVTEGNAPATRLYARAGFQPFGTEPMAVATAGGFRAKVHMWLPLHAAA